MGIFRVLGFSGGRGDLANGHLTPPPRKQTCNELKYFLSTIYPLPLVFLRETAGPSTDVIKTQNFIFYNMVLYVFHHPILCSPGYQQSDVGLFKFIHFIKHVFLGGIIVIFSMKVPLKAKQTKSTSFSTSFLSGRFVKRDK